MILMETDNLLRLGQNDDGRRLDRILRIALHELPLSAIHKALRKGNIRVNGARQPPEYRCRVGDIIEYSIARGLKPVSPLSQDQGSAHTQLTLDPSLILKETEDLLFINKPAGLLVHDGERSLEAMVKRYLSSALDASLSFSPGPLHRLDRNTSGIVAFSRSIKGARVFSEALRQGNVRKLYLALLEGQLESPMSWNDMISRDPTMRKSFIGPAIDRLSSLGEAKEAAIEMNPIVSNGKLTLAAVKLKTGRTHQIRAQASTHGYPLAGDLKYGGKPAAKPYYLPCMGTILSKSTIP